MPAHRLAELQSAHGAPTYAYLFQWSPPLLARWLGACHGIEIPFVFGTLREPILTPLFVFAPGASRLSARMQAAWAAFEEAWRGRAAVGQVADLTVLDGTLTDTAPEALLSTRVALTIVGGRVVFER